MPRAAVETRELTKKFGSFTAVDHITMSIEEGSVYGFLGPNGSGKSTTIRMLCGLLAPTSGVGLVLGMDLAREGRKIKDQVGYMPRSSAHPEMTVIENLIYSPVSYVRIRRNALRKCWPISGGREDEYAGISGPEVRSHWALTHRPGYSS